MLMVFARPSHTIAVGLAIVLSGVGCGGAGGAADGDPASDGDPVADRGPADAEARDDQRQADRDGGVGQEGATGQDGSIGDGLAADAAQAQPDAASITADASVPQCRPGAWSIDAIGSGGKGAALALDPHDGVHVSHLDASRRKVKHAYRAAGGPWTSTTVGTVNVGGFSRTSIAVDATGTVHIAYHDYVGKKQRLNYARRPAGGAWQDQVVHSGGSAGLWNALAIDATGRVHITDRDGTDLRYTRSKNGASGWGASSPGAGGLLSAVAVDGQGGVHISHIGPGSALRLTARLAGAGAWSTTIVDAKLGSGAGGARTTALALDQAGGVHLGYYDTKLRLKYAKGAAGGSFASRVLAKAPGYKADGTARAYAALALDGRGGVHISSADSLRNELAYTYKATHGTAFTREVVDSGKPPSPYGRFWSNAIAVDAAEGVHIAYHDLKTDDLKYAYRPCLP